MNGEKVHPMESRLYTADSALVLESTRSRPMKSCYYRDKGVIGRTPIFSLAASPSYAY